MGHPKGDGKHFLELDYCAQRAVSLYQLGGSLVIVGPADEEVGAVAGDGRASQPGVGKRCGEGVALGDGEGLEELGNGRIDQCRL